MGFLEDRDLSDVPTIPEFYKGKTVLITGGSGFMGQVLIEKLLYSCSEVKQIILLMRYKKGSTLDKRLADLYSSSVFSVRLKKEKPGLYESKVIAVHGDVAENDLDLSKADREYIKENVNIIFHSAASVRFNDDLPKATKTNVRSARELISLAKEVKNLLAYVHVSTCYSNSNYGKYIEEKMYPPHADWRDTIAICENVEKDTIDHLTNKYIGDLPNTYVFTKQLAEHLVTEQRGKLPVIIIRPSVVISAIKEPGPGWVNTFNGPAGISFGYAKGVLRDLLVYEEVNVDYVPVDYCINHFLAAAWIRGTKPLEPTDEVEIYNCSANDQFMTKIAMTLDIGSRYLLEYPINTCIWPPAISTTRSPTIHYFRFLVYQLLPAIFFDTILWLLGKKTVLVRLQRKLRQIDIALFYYMVNAWQFDNKNFRSLLSCLKEQDRQQFDYDMSRINRLEYMKDILVGGKIYLLKEDLADVPRAKKRLFWMKVMAFIVKTILFCCIVWKLFNTSYVQNYYQRLVGNINWNFYTEYF